MKDLANGTGKQLTNTGDFVSDPRWSPSGKWLTAVRELTYQTPGGFRANTFWIMDASGKRGRALENFADWHPHEDQLALARQVTDGVEITVQDADGGNERIILASTEERELGLVARWSPDGLWLAYTTHIRDPAPASP